MLDWGRRFSYLQGGNIISEGREVCVCLYKNLLTNMEAQQKIPMPWDNYHLYLKSGSGLMGGSSPLVVVNISACVAPTSRISELKDFSLNLFW